MERAAAVMAALAYLAYLVALLASPLLVQWRGGRGLPWRWGLALALEVTVAELALVFVVSEVGWAISLVLGVLPGMWR